MGGKITKVLSGIYIGSNDNAKHEEQLMAHCISHILSVQSSELDTFKLPNIVYHTVYVGKPSGQSLLRVIPECNDFIHSARITSGCVLVHSESGMSSNVAVVAAYLMTVYQLSSSTAVSVLQGLVHAAQPTNSLQDQLDRFDPPSPDRVGTLAEEGMTEEFLNDEISCKVNVNLERARLLTKFGPWPKMESDRNDLEAALCLHKDLKESGAFLAETKIADSDGSSKGGGKSGILRTTAPLHSLSSQTGQPPPHVPLQSKFWPADSMGSVVTVAVPRYVRQPLDRLSTNLDDGDLCFNEDLNEFELEVSSQDEEAENSRFICGEENEHEEENDSGRDDDDEIVGSMPIRGAMQFMSGGYHGRGMALPASYRPPSIDKNFELGEKVLTSSHPHNIPSKRSEQSKYSTTLPVGGWHM